MDKKYKSTLIIFLIVVFLIGFIDASKTIAYKDQLDEVITNHSWERETAADTETIYFTEDGKFGYYCACGSPVDYYDACDSYKYDKETNTIKLNCLPVVKVKEIKILESTNTKLVLDFNGEKREFITPYRHLIENPLPFAGTNYISTSEDKITLEFTKKGNFEVYNVTKEKYDLGSDTCFTWEYKEENKITLDCQDETRTIEIKNYNKETKELELYFKKEKKTYKFIEQKDNN